MKWRKSSIEWASARTERTAMPRTLGSRSSTLASRVAPSIRITLFNSVFQRDRILIVESNKLIVVQCMPKFEGRKARDSIELRQGREKK